MLVDIRVKNNRVLTGSNVVYCQRSWTNFHSPPLDFLTDKIRYCRTSARDNGFLCFIIFCYGLHTFKGLSSYGILFKSGKRF